MTTKDFNPGDRFCFANKHGHDPEFSYKVKDVSPGWIHCRAKNPNGGEYRYSFSDSYLKDAVIEMVYRAPVITEPDRRHAVRVAKKLLSATPIGEVIDFNLAAQELDKAA